MPGGEGFPFTHPASLQILLRAPRVFAVQIPSSLKSLLKSQNLKNSLRLRHIMINLLHIIAVVQHAQEFLEQGRIVRR